MTNGLIDTHVSGTHKRQRIWRRSDVPYYYGESYTQEQRNYLEIMGYIIPARTEALGKVNIQKEREENSVPLDLIDGFADMSTGFTNSNQGHSAEFHGYLSEPNRGRETYWMRVMEDGIKLDPYVEGNYSGLYPGSNVTGTQP